jgi:hypothetical protein
LAHAKENSNVRTLRLTRDVGSAAFELRRGPFEISVDGKPAGSIAIHDTVETTVEPGRHLVLRKGRYSSRTLTFDAADGEVLTFRVTQAVAKPLRCGRRRNARNIGARDL